MQIIVFFMQKAREEVKYDMNSESEQEDEGLDR